MIYYQHRDASLEAAILTLQTGVFHQVDGSFDKLPLRNRDGEWTVRLTENLASKVDMEAMAQRIRRLAKGE